MRFIDINLRLYSWQACLQGKKTSRLSFETKPRKQFAQFKYSNIKYRLGDFAYVIVGIDAGINVGYAVLDLNGALVAAGVEKEANDETIVKMISQVGIPSLVASDVHPPSSFVSKVAARFNVKVFYPQKSMTIDEKRLISRNILDPHIRDAYAAAVKAYRNYANRLRQVDKLGTLEDKNRLKHLIIQGQALTKILRPEGKTRLRHIERRSIRKKIIKKKG